MQKTNDFYVSVLKHGDNLLYRGYSNSKPIQIKIKHKPTLFVPDKEGEYKSIFGESVSPVQFESIKEAKAFQKQYESVGNFEIYGTDDWVAQYIQEQWPGEIHFQEDLINLVSLDIEVYSPDEFPEPEAALHPIDAITVKSSKSEIYTLFTYRDYDPDLTELEELKGKIRLVKCDTEIELLYAFLRWWEREYPDAVSGWYSRTFDIPYIVNRITRILGDKEAKRLSPWNIIHEQQVSFKGRDMQMYDLKGIAQLDMLDVFQKFGYKYGPQESYKLNHISHVVLGEKKLSYDEYDGLYDLADKDPQKYCDYNIKDAYLVQRIAEKTGLISLVYNLAYRAGVNFSDTFGTTRIWDAIIMRELMKEKVVVQPNESRLSTSYPGGYVKDPHVGKHDWIVSFDLNSLYPNLIVEYNMSPETLVQDDMLDLDVEKCLTATASFHNSYAVAANGSLYKKDKQGVIPKIIESYYAERKAVQKEIGKLKEKKQKVSEDEKINLSIEIDKLHNRQMTIKILMNSLYGALGSVYFRHYDLRMAEGITLSGQVTIKTAEKAVNETLNKCLKTKNVDYVVAIDTDSVYVNLAKVIDTAKPEDPVDFLADFSDKIIEPALQKSFIELSKIHNTFKPRMVMGREVIASKGFWTAKKRYALYVENEDKLRLTEPKLKVQGLEAIKSSTPGEIRKWLKEIFKVIMFKSENEFHEYVENKRQEFYSLAPEDIAAPRGVNNLSKYTSSKSLYVKGTPQHVRASLVYNDYIKKNNLTKFQSIGNGDKIKFIFLKMPNPTKEDVIAFPDVFPRGKGLEKYVDYETQFQKTFMDPIIPILDAIGWSKEESASLDDLF